MLADKKHLKDWIETGKRAIREDFVDINELLRSYSESLLHEKVISNSSVCIGTKNVAGFSFNIYQPFYKSCPVGMILDMEIRIDGKLIPRNNIYLILKGGQRIRLYEARTTQDIWWNIVDPVVVFIPRQGGLSAGNHELELTLAELVSEYYEHPKNLIMGSIKTTMSVN